MDIHSSLLETAGDLGFLAVGFAEPKRPLHFDHFLNWLAEGKHGQLAWLAKGTDRRENPGALLEGCRAIISLAYPYSARKPRTPDDFTVARYADPSREDYHARLKTLCREMVKEIRRAFPDSRSRVLVDSAPILERSIAFSAGLGFLGKNNMLIVPGHGSFLYLCEVLTTAPLEISPPRPMESGCGTCNRCVEACPAGALERPFCLDVAKCLSYLTIEHRGEVPGDVGAKMGDCFMGCDRCQEVCPFNGPAQTPVITLPPVAEILSMQQAGFEERFGRSALARAGLEKLQANIRAIKAAGKRPSCPG